MRGPTTTTGVERPRRQAAEVSIFSGQVTHEEEGPAQRKKRKSCEISIFPAEGAKTNTGTGQSCLLLPVAAAPVLLSTGYPTAGQGCSAAPAPAPRPVLPIGGFLGMSCEPARHAPGTHGVAGVPVAPRASWAPGAPVAHGEGLLPQALRQEVPLRRTALVHPPVCAPPVVQGYPVASTPAALPHLLQAPHVGPLSQCHMLSVLHSAHSAVPLRRTRSREPHTLLQQQHHLSSAWSVASRPLQHGVLPNCAPEASTTQPHAPPHSRVLCVMPAASAQPLQQELSLRCTRSREAAAAAAAAGAAAPPTAVPAPPAMPNRPQIGWGSGSPVRSTRSNEQPLSTTASTTGSLLIGRASPQQGVPVRRTRSSFGPQDDLTSLGDEADEFWKDLSLSPLMPARRTR